MSADNEGKMTSARLTTIVVSSALLSTWLVSAGVTRPGEDPPAPPAPPQAVDPIAAAAADLATQTARLQARLGDVPAPRAMTRNPFRFGHAEPRTSQPRRSSEVVAAAQPDSGAAVVTPPAPTIHLIGIAIDQQPSGAVRRAALSVEGEVVLVGVGDEVGSRYRVTAISPDVVELADRLGGPPLRLPVR